MSYDKAIEACGAKIFAFNCFGSYQCDMYNMQLPKPTKTNEK